MGKITPSSKLNSPAVLEPGHHLADFTCGQASLDLWLKQQALKSQKSGASRTYAVATQHNQVIGYYSLAVGSLHRAAAPGSIRRNMPDPVPMMLLARLAVDQDWHGQGIGRGLLKDAILRTLQAADIAGIRGMLVHSLSEKAKRFYQYFGFKVCKFKSSLLMGKLSDLQRALD